MKREFTYTVPERLNGSILRDVMKRELGFSAKQISRMKKQTGSICQNGKPVYVISRVKAGDLLHFVFEEEPEYESIVPSEGAFSIRFENADVLVVDKPAGLAVHPAPGDREQTLGNFVVGYYLARGEQIVYRPVNRLDRGTTGLMVIAKNAYSHAALARQMHTDAFVREYLAVTEGCPSPFVGTVNAPIAREEGSVLRRTVSCEGADAITHYQVEKETNDRSLVRLRLETGRTHQIRVHMSHIGCPLVGDFLYGHESAEIGRCALHSAYLSFYLPFSGERIELTAPLPDDMKKLLEREV